MIRKLKKNGAQISVWGVGTHLMTAYDHPALDGVYKLTALRDAEGVWQYKVKLSEQPVKISNPGIYQVRRFFRDGQQIMDVMYDVELGIPEAPEMIMLDDHAKKIKLTDYDGSADLLQPIFRKGKLVYAEESIHEFRNRALDEVKQFCRAFPEAAYPVGLEKNLYDLKQKLIIELLAVNQSE